METSLKDVYACGDVAEFNGKIIGLWQVAMEQGKVVGANICGEEKIYAEQVQPLSFEGMNTQLLSIGEIKCEADSRIPPIFNRVEFTIGLDADAINLANGEIKQITKIKSNP